MTGVHGQFATRAQIQTLSRNPAMVVPSVSPNFSKRVSRASTFPTWFIVAPQRKRWLTCARIWLVLDTPLFSRYCAISFRRRPVRLIKLHLLYGVLGFARLLEPRLSVVANPRYHLKIQCVHHIVCSCFSPFHSKRGPRIVCFCP